MTEREELYNAANNNEPANLIYAAANNAIRPEDTGLTSNDLEKATENKASTNLLATLESTVQKPIFTDDESKPKVKAKAKAETETDEVG